MMIDLTDLFSVILFASLIILVITTTVVMFNINKTIKKFNNIMDNVDIKVNKLNGLFDIIDNTTDVINTFSDKIATGISSAFTYLINRKRRDDKNE